IISSGNDRTSLLIVFGLRGKSFNKTPANSTARCSFNASSCVILLVNRHSSLSTGTIQPSKEPGLSKTVFEVIGRTASSLLIQKVQSAFAGVVTVIAIPGTAPAARSTAFNTLAPSA